MISEEQQHVSTKQHTSRIFQDLLHFIKLIVQQINCEILTKHVSYFIMSSTLYSF